MKKNVASQTIGAQMVSASDGSAFTGTVSVVVTGDAGTQGAGGGSVVHEGNGYHSYAPTQAETNFDHVAFTFTGTGAIPATVQVYTTFPQTGDSFARLGAPAGASVSADIAAIEAQTDDIGAAGAGLTAVPWNAAWDAEVQSEVQDAIEVNHLDHLLAVTYDPASKPGAADALLNELVESDAGVSRFTANALEQAPTAPTAAAIADAVWEEAIADHSGTAGSTAEALGAAGSAGDPWTTALPGAYGAGTAGKIVGDNLNATVSSRASQTSVDTIDDLLDTEVAAIKSDTAAILADTGTDGVVVAAASKTGYALSAAGVQAIWDALTSALTTVSSIGKLLVDNINATISSRATQTSVDTVDDFLDTEVAAIKAKTDQLTFTTANQVDAAVIDKTGFRLSAAGVDDVLDEVVEGTGTVRQYLRLVASALWGKLSGAATTTIAIRDTGDTKDRITATVDANGNRSAVTTDAT